MIPADLQTVFRFQRYFLLTASGVLILCTAVAIADTWQWPLVGDASLIHYICFLIDQGMSPYRDLGDNQLPGSYLVDWTVMHTLGMSAQAWRIFDLLLMIAASGGLFVITRPHGRFAALFASALFYLVHQRDGLAQGGQRDLTVAVLLLLCAATLIHAVRQTNSRPVAVFGLLAGFGCTIKPTALLFAAALFAWAVYALSLESRPLLRSLWPAMPALLVGPVIVAIFLWRKAAFRAFLESLRTVTPYYTSLGHRPLRYLVTHSLSPLHLLIFVWACALLVDRPRLSVERFALLGCSLLGLVSCVVQARGFPYYRYPLLAFLLPLIAIDFSNALRRSERQSGRLLAAAGIAVGAFFIAPVSAWSIHRYDPHNLDFITSLESTLNRLGGAQLSGHVQCIDSISGCGTTLYRMRLVQATGVLSDFLLFGPPEKPIIRDTRATFYRQITATPPRVIVVSSPLHIDGPGNYAKLDLWPEFRVFLGTRYCLAEDWSPTRPQRWWSRPEMPASFRVYTLVNLNTRCPPSRL